MQEACIAHRAALRLYAKVASGTDPDSQNGTESL